MAQYLEEIFSVATVIYEAWKVRPEIEPFFLNKTKLTAYPKAKEILQKLDKQYGVIKIVNYPYDDEFEEYDGMDADTIANKWAGGSTHKARKLVDNSALSYGLIINPHFDNR